MKKYIKYAIILAIACFCFILIDEVNAEECGVSASYPHGAVLTFDYTTNYGTGLSAWQIATKSPEYPIVKSFTLNYRYDAKGNYDTKFPLATSTQSCWLTRFRLRAPDDYRSIENYNRLSDWQVIYPSDNFSTLRYVNVYERNGYFYYDFYSERNGTTCFMLYDEKFTYTGNINPFVTDLNYESDAKWLSTEFISCSVIDDVKTSSEFDQVNGRLDGLESSINSNFDDLKQKQEEAHETSKGIWASLRDGISSIGNWFSDLISSITKGFGELASSIGNFFKELGESIANGFISLFESIKTLFVGEEVCEEVEVPGVTSEPNLFTGYDRYSRIMPDDEGWITITRASMPSNLTGLSNPKNLDIIGNTPKNAFIEIKEFSFTGTSFGFCPFFYGQASGYNVIAQFIDDSSTSFGTSHTYTNNELYSGAIFNRKLKPTPANWVVKEYYDFIRTTFSFSDDADFTFTFRLYITNDMDMTLDTYQYNTYDGSLSEPTIETICYTKGGLFGMLSDFFKSIGEFFARLFGFMEDDSVDSDNAGGFFSGFDTEDNGGISSVITAPLIAVKKMTNKCEPVHIPVYDTDVELPCGTTLFWDKPDVQVFRGTWNLIIGGAFIFFLLSKVFKVIEDIKDPESDKVEVMKL